MLLIRTDSLTLGKAKGIWALTLQPEEDREADGVLATARTYQTHPNASVKEGQRVQRNERAGLTANFE